MTDTPAAYQTAIDQLRAEQHSARMALEYANSNVTEAKKRAVAATDELRATKCQLADALARADAAEKERDDLAQKLGGQWIEREVDARLMADIGTGPVAYERNQLRDEVSELRAKLKAQSDGLNKHWQEQVSLARAEGRRRARNLATMLHAHVNAIAGEEP